MDIISSPPEAPGHQEGHPQRWRILAILNLSLILVVVAVSSLNVAIPTLVRELDASSAELQWIVDAYALVFAGLLLPAGALGDRFGRKRALVSGLVIFAVAALTATTASDPSHLIVIRAVMGIGAALIMPATLSIITNVFPPAERARAIATWAGFAGAGGAVGPLLSGLLLERFWWGSVFFINVPLALVLIVLVRMRVPESRDAEQRRFDPVGAMLSMVGLGGMLFGIIEGPERGWTSPITLVAFALAVICLVGFVVWEARSDAPMLDPRLFRIPGFGLGSLIVTVTFFAMFGMFFLFTQYLQFVHGYSPLGAAVRQVPAALTMVVIAPRSPRIAARFGARRSVSVGLVVQAVGFVLMATFRPSTSYPLIALGLVVVAFGMALVMPPATTAIVSSLPLSKAGVGSAVNDTTREVGGAIGIAVFGSIVSLGFRSRIDSSLSALPAGVRDVAGESIGSALAIARELPPEIGGPFAAAAQSAFAEAMTNSFLVGAAVLAILVAAVVRWLPDTSGTASQTHATEATR